MAKFWAPGRVKTRLGESIGMREAAALHQVFVGHLCQILAGVAAHRQVVLDPIDRLAEATPTVPGSWELVGQGSGDLGRRMAGWFEEQLAAPQPAGGAPLRAVLIGADCLTLGPRDINQAIDALDLAEVVLGPSVDGGYYLIGLRGPWRASYGGLFRKIPWSTGEVLALTLRRAQQAGLTVAQLAVQEDVDTVGELQRLRQNLQERSHHNSDADELRRAIESSLAASE